MILMIDNYDSFTYNIYQYLSELGNQVKVLRNDAVTFDEINSLEPEYIVISPGPCTPDQAGISVNIIHEYAGKIPILGVCLGHQCIGRAFGGKIVNAKNIMHGKTSEIHHLNEGSFKNIPSPYIVSRYHSLVIDKETLPECLEVTSWTCDEDELNSEIMGVRHKEFAIEGVQFHPESIMSEHGHLLLKNFLDNNLGSRCF